MTNELKKEKNRRKFPKNKTELMQRIEKSIKEEFGVDSAVTIYPETIKTPTKIIITRYVVHLSFSIFTDLSEEVKE